MTVPDYGQWGHIVDRSSQVKSMMLMSLYVRIVHETLLQLFNNIQC